MPKMQELTWQQKFVTNPANALTTSRIVLGMVVVWLELTGHGWWALATFVAAAATDWLDGLVAKNYKGGTYSSDWGKIYDPIADKVLIWLPTLIITGQTWFTEEPPVTMMLIGLLAILAIRDWDVPRLKRRHWERTGKVTSAIQSGRVAMVLLCVAVGVLLLPDLNGWWRYVPFLIAFDSSMYAWWQYVKRYR